MPTGTADNTMAVPPNTHLIDYLGITIYRYTHPSIKKIKRKHSSHTAHGNKIWLSSYVLMDYLSTYPPESESKILDVGCGWGLISIFLAKNYGVEVTAIDIDQNVEPYLDLHASANDCNIEFQTKGFETLSNEELAHYSSIVAADICFWDEMVQPLFNFITRARRCGLKTIYISDPGRPPFWELCDLCTAAFGAEIVTRRIYEPTQTEKFILAISIK